MYPVIYLRRQFVINLLGKQSCRRCCRRQSRRCPKEVIVQVQRHGRLQERWEPSGLGAEARETPHVLQKHRDALKPSAGGNGRRNGPMLLSDMVSVKIAILWYSVENTEVVRGMRLRPNHEKRTHRWEGISGRPQWQVNASICPKPFGFEPVPCLQLRVWRFICFLWLEAT